jgi:phosphoribosylaminoimidazolecarboxamide formyltransferase/IMP cyclohydrolase
MLPKGSGAQLKALEMAWAGDPVSAFGGVLVFSDPIESDVASWLSERFVELVAAPGLSAENAALKTILTRRKNLKAVAIRRFGGMPEQSVVAVPGGKLYQTTDTGTRETLKSVTKKAWPENLSRLSRFGIACCRTLKSNAIALVREIPEMRGACQLVGAGQGQPNRIEALKVLAVPRARSVIGNDLSSCVMVSDAFFPFRDTVDTASEAGIRFIIQPGGSLKDAESIAACDEHGIAMAFTGTRHFKH